MAAAPVLCGIVKIIGVRPYAHHVEIQPLFPDSGGTQGFVIAHIGMKAEFQSQPVGQEPLQRGAPQDQVFPCVIQVKRNLRVPRGQNQRDQLGELLLPVHQKLIQLLVVDDRAVLFNEQGRQRRNRRRSRQLFLRHERLHIRLREQLSRPAGKRSRLKHQRVDDIVAEPSGVILSQIRGLRHAVSPARQAEAGKPVGEHICDLLGRRRQVQLLRRHILHGVLDRRAFFLGYPSGPGIDHVALLRGVSVLP